MASQTLQDAQFKLNADAWSRHDGRKATHENRVWQAFAPVFGAPGAIDAGKLMHITCAFNGHTLSSKTGTSRARAYLIGTDTSGVGQLHAPGIPSCDYEASGGTDGVDWWKHELPREYKVKWAELRKYATRVLSQTSTETSAERHFSLMEVEQPKGRSALGIGRTGDMVFVRSEILQHMDDRCSSITAINTLEELDSWNGEQEAEVLVDEHGAPAVPPAQLAQHAQPAAGPPPVAQLQAELNSAAAAGAGN